jgi:hypothetical protein
MDPTTGASDSSEFASQILMRKCPPLATGSQPLRAETSRYVGHVLDGPFRVN